MANRAFDNKGVYSLLLTPFKEDRSIDFEVYKKYVEWQSRQGAQHLFACCGSSEMTTLTPDERIELATLAVKHANGTPVVATANVEPTWHGQVEEIKRMEQTGVEGLVFVTKGYCDNNDRMFTYLSELAEHTTLPIILYEFPGMQPHLMDAECYGKLVETGKFHGIKDTTCRIEKIKEKIAVQGDSAVLQANIPYLMEAYEAGARGVVATPTSCGAYLFSKMYDEFFVQNDREAANYTHQQICVLDNAIDSGFCASAKYLVRLCGIEGFNWYTRGSHNLNPQRLKSLRVFFDWAKATGFKFYND
ncbi:MAG: dihydrodipicolinate synthase family protein [Clostridia bacterium]|nr:dihydrodipicolinate synthase family protein [Clostridia bacterium]